MPNLTELLMSSGDAQDRNGFWAGGLCPREVAGCGDNVRLNVGIPDIYCRYTHQVAECGYLRNLINYSLEKVCYDCRTVKRLEGAFDGLEEVSLTMIGRKKTWKI